MKTSIASVCLSGPLADKLQSAANAGFGGVEIFENDLIGAPQDAKAIAQMMRDLGLECTMFQPFRDLEGMPEPQRSAAFARMERKFEIMDALGTDLVLLCSNCSPAALPDRQRMLDDLGELGELAARHGKRIGYEALAWGRHVNDHRDAWSLVRDVDHPSVGLVLDSFHSLARDIPSSSIGDIRSDKLFFVQLADAPRLSMDALSWSRHFRVLPGQGDWPVAEYVAAIQRTGYDGWFSLEIFNDQFRAGAASQLAVDGHRSLRFLEDEAVRVSGRQPVLPDRVAATSTEFIEFAASDEEAEEFAQYFRALGFTPVAKHRSKDVTRWKQGEINFVINSEPDGHAHSHEVVHGGSVCAIGLGVTDPDAAMERAKALGIQRFEQAVAPDEWDIAGVRGMGGSVLYLVDAAKSEAMWAEEFPHQQEEEGTAPLLTRIDHVAQTMQQGEFLSWLLFYHSLFDMDTTAQLEIADPMGLIYSQAVQNADRSVRFTLNGSLAHQSLSSRFIRNYFGAGVQHIALATDDIFKAAQSATEAGLPLLEIGPNYYDDIEARFGLEPKLLERLRAGNILYDRDEQGEYFQFYSRAVAKRVFFEVVQRRDYDAFGAANAAIRLSAQASHREPEWM
ncbi:bifunctional sugar phosphate isomerase/epimerase/4-hydroxyphenylpyruvate dioxygenase family protein [Aurantiacibacter rhizosphaerae]|uniref:3-dehydroshikimate dehydratase n=1 Tax=Aurantiacibacter rhizosphaerae TaxID=2691582 RepID=A0A844XDU3_9SPHN|nr:sugar phosphate isomerase/epimerase and 4-hydroxyphenylpyruvate domain-containing protein [Aurantiacibacter rhizosphaerae]MWV28186.1 TIM barrel protein [Aurantiacibacter rhizosphaerae]